MEKLPLELLQTINDKLDFFDQLNFKSISKGFYECIQIKQIIPLILVVISRPTLDWSPDYIIPLNKFYLLIDKFQSLNDKFLQTNLSEVGELISYYYLYCEFFIIVPNKQININSRQNTMAGGIRFQIQGNVLLLDDKPFNLKIFIRRCLDSANKSMLDENIV